MPAHTTAEIDSETCPLLQEQGVEIATMDQWWALTRRFPEKRRESHHLLKDFGYMGLMSLFDLVKPERALEFGHGFNSTLMAYAQDQCEMHGIDDDQHLNYFPSGKEWEDLYTTHIAEPCAKSELHRGLLGDQSAHDLQSGSFDMIASVSVLEELAPDVLGLVLADAARLLRPGGILAGTFDVMLRHTEALRHLVSECEACGLEIGEVPPPLGLEAWSGALIESPTCVMLSYQLGQPEDRTFSGHWGSAWFVARKPA